LKKLILIGITSLFVFACGENSDTENREKDIEKPVSLYVSSENKELYSKAIIFFNPLPSTAENIDNPITSQKVKLGKVLFLDTRLSKDGNISCNSCHKLNSYGVDNLATSPGDEGNNGDRNSPTVYNAALHSSQFWDGRAKDVEEQSGMPILNPVEMNIPNEAFLVARLKDIEEYQPLFTEAFPDNSKPISYANLQLAIGAFERTLLTPSHFDDFLNGDENALSDDEKEGLNEFINVGCVTCHSGPAVGGNMLQKFGLYGDYWIETGSENIDEGRYAHSGKEAEKYVFKVPSLRNIEKTGPYLHDGSISELSEVIRIMGKLQLNKELTVDQINSIEIFLKSLTGDLPVAATL